MVLTWQLHQYSKYNWTQKHTELHPQAPFVSEHNVSSYWKDMCCDTISAQLTSARIAVLSSPAGSRLVQPYPGATGL